MGIVSQIPYWSKVDRMKPKLKAIGAPFNTNHSSCFALKPKNFEWTTEGDYPVVVMDRAITRPDMINGVPDKYAWLCESRAMLPEHDRILQDQRILSSYKAIYISDKTKLSMSPNLRFCFAGSNYPWLPILNNAPQKTKMCSMIASPKTACAGHHYRHQVARKYMGLLDLYGGACGSTRIGFENKTVDGHPDKSSAIVPYRFSIVMENDIYPDYFTEKITDCFASWTVPVYWGCPTIDEYFNPEGIIKFDDGFDINCLTEELYQSMLPAIEENNQIVRNLVMSDDMLFDKIRNSK